MAAQEHHRGQPAGDHARGRYPDPAFGSDGRVTGYGGVNRFAGTYKFSPQGVLSFPAPGLITTRMAGPPEIMDKERAYLKGLAQATRAIVAKDGLQLQNEDGATVLVFEQVK